MKKYKAVVILTIIFLVYVIFNMKSKFVFAIENESNQKNKIILIDPGHGGIDGGAQSESGTVEKNINLSIGLKLKKILQQQGYNIILTREEDKGLYTEGGTIRKKKVEDLSNRCKMKEESNCSIFVSIHLNMFPQGKYYGSQVWYSKNEESKRLAHIIQQNLIADLKDNSGRIEKPALDSYKILRCGKDIPSVIVECGFLSNKAEEQKLKNDEYQQKIAESLGNSIKNFL